MPVLTELVSLAVDAVLIHEARASILSFGFRAEFEFQLFVTRHSLTYIVMWQHLERYTYTVSSDCQAELQQSNVCSFVSIRN